MAIQLATKYNHYVDEVMKAASKSALIAGANFEFKGAHEIRLYKIGTAPMQDYGRNSIAAGNWSHYGEVTTLDATTESLILEKDRSFTFEIDRLDEDETAQNLEAASALNRQLREVVIPEVDAYTYNAIIEKAGIKPAATALTSDNVYEELAKGSEALDEAEAPEEGRYILVTPATLRLMKLNKYLAFNEDVGKELRTRGVVGTLDGASIVKVPASRLPDGFGFLYGHPMAACAPTKLTDYTIHRNPPGPSGSLVEGRINYDAFVLENKANALYCQAVKETEAGPAETTPTETESQG